MAKSKQKSSQGGKKEDAWIVRGAADDSDTIYLRDEMVRDADLVYDRLDAGAHLHCCESKDLEQSVLDILSSEAKLRREDLRAKIAAWRRNGQWHTECMCRKASERAPPAPPNASTVDSDYQS